MSYVADKIAPLLDRVVDPIVGRLSKAPIIVVIFVLCVMGGTLAIIYHPGLITSSYNIVVSAINNAIYAGRVATADSKTIPLSPEIVERIKITQQRIASTIDSELSEMSQTYRGGPLSAWSAAQDIVSVSDFDPSILDRYKKTFVDFIYANVIPGCGCWAETPDRNRDFHNPFISGWIFYALSKMGVPASDDALNTLLLEQSKKGWWSTFPVNNGKEYASSYTTAWALLGLFSQKEKGYISKEKSADVEKALKRGSEWLLSVREGPRWKSYPYYTEEATESESISGLVLHVLNKILGEEAIREVNEEWIDDLPERVILASDVENYDIQIQTPSGAAFDHFKQLQMPWATVATVDAYASGTVAQRAKVIQWLEDIFNDKSVQALDARGDWWRAEVLYSLNYAMKK